jgi:hypothetical protein
MPAHGARMTPQQQQQKWIAGMNSGGQRWAAGCQGTQKNLFQLALAKAGQAQANYAAAVAPGGSWNTAMQAGNMQSWKTACQASVSRFNASKPSAQANYLSFATKVGSYYNLMADAASAQNTWQAKVVAAIQVLVDAGRHGQNQLKAKSA